MSYRDQWKELSEAAEQAGIEMCRAQDKWNDCRDKRDSLISNIILEEKLLSKTQWDLVMHVHGNSAYLSASDGIHGLPELTELARIDYHCRIQIDDVYLSFDDNNVSIDFRNVSSAMEFINKHNVNIVTNKVLERLNLAKQEVKSLEAMLVKFGVKIDE